MGVDLTSYRRSIGLWAVVSARASLLRERTLSSPRSRPSLVLFFYLFLLLRAAALPAAGDVQLNPGPSLDSNSLDSKLNSRSGTNRHSRLSLGHGGRGSVVARKFSIYSVNARSLLPKKSELVQTATSLQPSIIAVTETWLSSAVPDGSLVFPGYSSVARVDRSACGDPDAKSRGGGVLFLVHDSVNSVSRPDLRDWPESVWIEVKLNSSRPIIIGSVYRPPASAATHFVQALETTVSRLDLSRCHLVLVGDFNAKSPSWQFSDDYNPAGHVLETTFLQLGLHQHVSQPTHLSSDGGLGALLDLVLSSSPSLVTGVSTHPPLGSSDHLAVLSFLEVKAERVSRCAGRRIWSFDKADFNRLNKTLDSADWSAVHEASDADAAWASWQSTFLPIVHKFVPSRVVKNIKQKSPFVTPSIERAIKEKRMALRELKRCPTEANRKAFKTKRNLVTHLLRKSERAHATTLYQASKLSSSPSTSQQFWQHLKVVQGKSSALLFRT